MTNSFITPSDYAIHVVEKRMTIDALVIVLYNAPTEKTLNELVMLGLH
ncbi:hypothetical protein [Pseudoalteromonas mariniglutinosa]